MARNDTWTPPEMPVADAIQIVATKTGLAPEVVRLVVQAMIREDAYAAEGYKRQNYDLGMHRGQVRGMRYVFQAAKVTGQEIDTIIANMWREAKG